MIVGWFPSTDGGPEDRGFWALSGAFNVIRGLLNISGDGCSFEIRQT
jgi:hypothetical protein